MKTGATMLRPTPIILLLSCAAAALLITNNVVSATADAAAQPDPSYFDTIYHPLMTDHLYSNGDNLSTPPSTTGAIGVNNDYENGQTDEYYIEQQRYGADWIAAGISTANQDYVDKGILILEWGFDRMDPSDGSFPGSGDAVHSASLFLEAVSRAALLLQQSGDNDPTARVASWTPLLLSIANYVSDMSTAGSPGRANNLEPFAHRYFLRAAGIQAAATLNGGDEVLESAARALVQEGLSLQSSQGVLYERDGFDFNYQSIGIAYLGRYAQLVLGEEGTLDTMLETQIIEAMQESLSWFQARVDSLGNVDLSDSSRMNESSRSGRPKSLDTKNIVQGYLSADLLTGDGAYLVLAGLMANPTRPIVEYIFQGPDTLDGQKSTGSDESATLYARTAENAKNTAPLGPAGSGVTGEADDYALDMTSVSSMGRGSGPFVRTDGSVSSIDALASFTLTGWYRTDGTQQQLGGNIELFKTDRLKLTSVNTGRLRLFVDSHSGSDSVVSANSDWNLADEWGFFAVTYDGTEVSDNVKFYSGGGSGASGEQVRLSSTQTLDRGAVASKTSRLYVNRQNRPFDGLLDNMRIYGSKVDKTGVLSLEQISHLFSFDTSE